MLIEKLIREIREKDVIIKDINEKKKHEKPNQ